MTQRAGVSRVMIRALLVVGAIPLLAMMALIVGNSLGRVFFNTPIKLTIEGSGLLGIILVATAIGFAERERVNVAVRIVFERFPERVRVVVESFTLILSLVGAAYLFWAVVDSARSSLSIHEATIAARIPITPFKLIWAAGILILCLFLAQHLIEDIIKIVKGGENK
jgi:TRAP-type C4-dicarboxylate transport system permease small subunit